jgi:mono/diheme cytochrome c family protein
MKPCLRLRLRSHLLLLSALLLAFGPWPTAWAQGRGELLYNTHCVACHSTQMHWRDKRQVVDWPTLRTQVRLWQATGLLAWDEADIDHVARYLNDTYYRYPNPAAVTTGQASAARQLAQH